MFKEVEPQKELKLYEEEILTFWDKNRIFEKSLAKNKGKPKFIFYEGPPTANAAPHIGHVLIRIFNDIILRYKTMRGFYVKRRAGWDTHGLPVELQVEKELGFKTKSDIEKYGIAKFNQKCKDAVWRYKQEWEKVTSRIGFWLDFKHAYITYENSYIEKIWEIIKKISDKGLLYRGQKTVPYCPRCGTPLSSHELALGYEEVEDPSVYVKFKILNPATLDLPPNTSFLVWTTTPWTLPCNTALALRPNAQYAIVNVDDEHLILARDHLRELDAKYTTVRLVKGKDLVGLKYEPPYPLVAQESNAYKTWSADFVSLEEGTGVVHVASAYGEDDFSLSQEKNLPLVKCLDSQGNFERDIERLKLKGLFFKDADAVILDNLASRGLVWKVDKIIHTYPFCWRCTTPLIYQAMDSWFIKMSKLKSSLQQNNQKINWIPNYIKDGRFGNWLKELKDWAISRQRYWGTPLPIWICQNCEQQTVVGSIQELKKMAIFKINFEKLDLHRPYIDEVKIKCPKCGGEALRIEDVLDVWFDSGAMPFASDEYPDFYPADYIAEGIDQTRGWFYTLLAISTLIGLKPSYKNVISLGFVLDEKGQKMSKSKGNVVDPKMVIGQVGVDSLRWYLFTANQIGDNIRFSLKDLKESANRALRMLWNVYIFYDTYANANNSRRDLSKKAHILDRWIVSKLNGLIKKVTRELDNFQIVNAARLIEKFIDDLSNWYLRHSRKRTDSHFLNVLYSVLMATLKLAAPFIPFISETIYQNLKTKKDALSLHLTSWPKEGPLDKALEAHMEETRSVVEKALALRGKAGIKIRQVLKTLTIDKKLPKEYLELIKQAVNVKEVKIGKRISLDTKLTPVLLAEGMAREIIRQIQDLRKAAGLKVGDKAEVFLEPSSKDFASVIKNFGPLIEQETKTKIFLI